MAENRVYLSMPVANLFAEREFPGAIYLYINHKFLRYKNKSDLLDTDSFNKLIYNGVKFIFIEEQDRHAFEEWCKKSEAEDTLQEEPLATSEDTLPVLEAVKEQRRAMMDVFDSPKDDKQVKAAIDVSKKMVTEFLKKPYAINNITSLQRYSKGCVDHSVNVAVLCVFIGLRMGYTHQVILEHLALGGLFHDIGKTVVQQEEGKMLSDDDPAMQEHPILGKKLLENIKEVTNEVLMIVAQHHEYLDGSGFPTRLKGLSIYDLARVVAIANVYDNMISESMEESVKARAMQAVERLENEFDEKLDPKKLEKAIKIIKYSFL